MYDFGLEVGDSILHYGYINIYGDVPEDRRFSEDSVYIYVSKIDSITLLDGRRAKRMHYECHGHEHYRVDIEYVGCAENGLFSVIGIPEESTCGKNVYCCSLDGEPIYEDSLGVCAQMGIYDVLPIVEEYVPSATILLHNGQLLIRRGDKTYDAQGREVNCAL